MADNLKVKVSIEGDDNLSPSAQSAARSLDKVGDAADRASGSTKKAHSAVDVLAHGLAGPVVAAATAVAGGLAYAATTAAEFEKTVSAIAAVTGASAEEMTQLSDLALDLGAKTSFSAKEAAEGIGELAKGGVSVADIMGGAAVSALNLAAAGGVGVGEAAALAANAMSLFNIQGSEMGKVADSIAGFANATTGSVIDFKYALSSVGAAAHLAGQDFEDTATAIALMGKAGILGSDAGTSLKTMLLNLQPSTKAQVAEFGRLGIATLNESHAVELLRDELGRLGPGGLKVVTEAAKDGITTSDELYKGLQKLSPTLKDLDFNVWAKDMGLVSNAFLDAEGNFKDLGEIAGILHDRLDGLSESQKTASLEIMFGSDAIRAAAILTEAGAEGFNAMADAMGHVSAESVAATRLDNLSGSMDSLNGSVETAAILLGRELTPTIRELAEAGTAFLNDTAIPWIKEYGPSLGAAIRDGAHAGGELIAAIAPLWEVAGPALRQEVDSWGQSIDGAIDGFYKTVVAAVDLKNGVGDAFDATGTAVHDSLDGMGTFVTSRWAEIGNQVGATQTTIHTGITEVWNAIPEDIRVDLEKIGGHLTSNFGTFLTNTTSWLNTTETATSTSWGKTSGTVTTEVDKIGTTIGTAFSDLGTKTRGYWDAVEGAISGPLTTAYTSVTTFVSNVGTAINGLAATLLTEATAAGGAMVTGLVNGMAGGLDRVKSTAGDIARGGLSSFKSVLGIESPSKEMHEVGGLTIEGLILGMQARAADLYGVASSITAGVLQQFAPLRAPLGDLDEEPPAKPSRYAPLMTGGDGQDMPDMFGPNPAGEALLIQYGYLEEAASDYAAEVWDVGDASRALTAAWESQGAAGQSLEEIMYGQNEAAIALLQEYGFLTEAGQSLEEIMYGDNAAARDLLAEFGLLETGVDDLGEAFDDAGVKATRWGAVIAGETTETGEKVHEFTHAYLGNLVAIGEASSTTATMVVRNYQAIAMGAAGLTSIIGDATRAFEKLNAAAAAGPGVNAYGGGTGGTNPSTNNSHTLLPTAPYPGTPGAAYLAAGTPDWGGGWAMLGEQGPELAYLPPHAAVYPHGTGPGGGEPIDYGRLATAVASALQGITVEMDRQPVGRMLRTEQRYYNQSNLSNGVGGL